MLSEQEREWLERRKDPKNIDNWDYPCSNPLAYDRLADFIDASQFEARVQKWLMYQYEKAHQCKEVSDGFLPDRSTMLMFARLAAEAEMDK